MARKNLEIIVDAVVRLLTDKWFLTVLVVFGGAAIWGREYVGSLLDMLGDLISKAKS